MKIEKVSINDYQKILELNNENNLVTFSEENWKNIWLKNPYYKKVKNWTVGWKIINDSKIVGVILNIPLILKYSGKNYLAAVCNNFVVNENYRSLSLKLRYLFLNQNGVDLLITNSANEKAEKIMLAFKAKKIVQYDYQNRLVLLLNKRKAIISALKNFSFTINLDTIKKILFKKKIVANKNLTFVEQNKFDADFSNLEEKIQGEKNIFSSKSLEWLDWKYNRYKTSKKLFVLKVYESNEFIGFVVMIGNIEKKFDLKRLTITEIFMSEQKISILNDITNHCVGFGIKNNYDVLDLVGFRKEKRQIFEKFGFIKKKSKNFSFLVKNNKDDLKNVLFESHDKLDLSLTDGDGVLYL